MWLADGTFKCVPKAFGQSYTVYGLIESQNSFNRSMPLVYMMLPNIKTKKLMTRALRAINILRENSPENLICNFEISFECFVINFLLRESNVVIFSMVKIYLDILKV